MASKSSGLPFFLLFCFVVFIITSAIVAKPQSPPSSATTPPIPPPTDTNTKDIIRSSNKALNASVAAVGRTPSYRAFLVKNMHHSITPIKGSYIVETRPDAPASKSLELFQKSLKTTKQKTAVLDHALHGFTISNLSPAHLNKLQKDPSVLTIHYDYEVFHVSRNQRTIVHEIHEAPLPKHSNGPVSTLAAKPHVTSAGWNIIRVGGCAQLDNLCNGDNKSVNSNAQVYVLDTGASTNANLNIVESKSFVTSERSVTDLNGHGSHVSGIIGAKDNNNGVIGVAPGIRIHAYKVLNKSGSGSFSGIINAVNAVATAKAALHQNSLNLSFVVSLSLGAYSGTSSYNALDTAIQNAINSYNIVFCIAAGNDGADAIDYTPSHVTEALTVSSYGTTNHLSSFSNYGDVVDIAGPGENITSYYKGNQTASMSGTSM